MNMAEKKKREFDLLRGFYRCYPHFPIEKVPLAPIDEQPDFILPMPNGVLGIEITEIHQPVEEGHRPIKEQEILRSLVLSSVEALYSQTDNPSVHVSVHFNRQNPVHKPDVDHLAKRVVGLVQENMSAHGSRGVQMTEENWKRWPPEIGMIHCHRYESGREIKSTFFSADEGFVPDLDSAWVQENLNRKNSLCTAYRKKCDEIWMVIVADGFAISSVFTVPPSLSAFPFLSAFDKAFLYQHFEGKCIELRRR